MLPWPATLLSLDGSSDNMQTGSRVAKPKTEDNAGSTCASSLTDRSEPTGQDLV